MFLIGSDAEIRVTYLRAVKRWSLDQRKEHRMAQCRKAIALSSAYNHASARETLSSKPKLAASSTSSLERVPLVAEACGARCEANQARRQGQRPRPPWRGGSRAVSGGR